MPTEYWLQKKAFNSWSHVTWYDSLEEATTNFNKVSIEGNGYSWRMVRVEVVEVRLLEGERPVLPPEPEQPIIKNSGWAATPASNGWAKPIEHGLAGKVWLANRELNQKKRVDPSEVDAMIKAGWFKAGPRTVL